MYSRDHIRGRIFFRMIRCYFSCEDIPDKITEEARREKKEAFQREEQRWISRFERKINFRHSRWIIDYPILAANLFDLFSPGKNRGIQPMLLEFSFFFFPLEKSFEMNTYFPRISYKRFRFRRKNK